MGVSEFIDYNVFVRLRARFTEAELAKLEELEATELHYPAKCDFIDKVKNWEGGRALLSAARQMRNQYDWCAPDESGRWAPENTFFHGDKYDSSGWEYGDVLSGEFDAR